MSNDFYAEVAAHRGITRKQAKTSLLMFLYSSDDVPLLDIVPPQWRAELLARKGVFLGEN